MKSTKSSSTKNKPKESSLALREFLIAFENFTLGTIHILVLQ